MLMMLLLLSLRTFVAIVVFVVMTLMIDSFISAQWFPKFYTMHELRGSFWSQPTIGICRAFEHQTWWPNLNDNMMTSKSIAPRKLLESCMRRARCSSNVSSLQKRYQTNFLCPLFVANLRCVAFKLFYTPIAGNIFVEIGNFYSVIFLIFY